MKLWQIMLASASAATAVPAIAQMAPTPPTPAQPPQTRAAVETRVTERLGRMDADRNGIVTREERRSFVDARRKLRADERFATMDADKNGQISRAEFDARAIARPARGAWRERRAMNGGAGLARQERRGMTIMAVNGEVVIADAVKRALERFDATDTDKNGTISPEERRAAREAWRAKRMSRTG